MQLPVRFTAGWGATAESRGASASHPRPAHPRPVQLGAVGGAAAGRWPPSAALHVSAGHALAGASCERHTWFARWIAAWYRPAACAQPPRSVSRVRRPAGLPPAPHQPQRRGRPEPASAAEDEDDAYLLAKSYFDMKARPAPPRRSPRRAPPATPPRRAALLPCCLCTPAQRQGVSRERRPRGAGRARRRRAQEYRRAAHALRGAAGPRALFLRGYARYLAGELRREEERVEAAGPLGKTDAANAVRAPGRPPCRPPRLPAPRPAASPGPAPPGARLPLRPAPDATPLRACHSVLSSTRMHNWPHAVSVPQAGQGGRPARRHAAGSAWRRKRALCVRPLSRGTQCWAAAGGAACAARPRCLLLHDAPWPPAEDGVGLG